MQSSEDLGRAQPGHAGLPLILGIDPGLSQTGWALLAGDSWVVGCGSWQTDADESLPARVADIGRRVGSVLRAHDVTAVAVEKFVHMGPATNWSAVAGTLRVLERVVSVCDARRVPVVELTPSQAKRRLGIVGKPTHEAITAAFRNVPERTNEHGRDALLLAWCGWESGVSHAE